MMPHDPDSSPTPWVLSLQAEGLAVLAADGRTVCRWEDANEALPDAAKIVASVNAHATLSADLARAVADRKALLEALRQADVVMDTAAEYGVGDLLPPAYRDSWAAAHTSIRDAIAAARS